MSHFYSIVYLQHGGDNYYREYIGYCKSARPWAYNKITPLSFLLLNNKNISVTY